MTFKLYNATHDHVIKSAFAVGEADYGFALASLFPLIGRFDDQRKTQNAKFYQRLRDDILKGCVMPPITIAFVSSEGFKSEDPKKLEAFVLENISQGYILDGMQRLNTLHAASQIENFDPNRPIYVNVIVAEKYDYLLYRMITLNNGQKPMTPRHQIEILAKNLVDGLKFKNIHVQKEKDTEQGLVHGAFKLGDLAAAYTAFLTDNPNNQNNKIIDDKMNEILVGRVMSSDLGEAKAEFAEILALVDNFSENRESRAWLKFQNNLIGFTLGAKRSFDVLSKLDGDEFSEQTAKFERAFDVINPSKVNVGRFRRELAQQFFEKFQDLRTAETDDVIEHFVDLTTSD